MRRLFSWVAGCALGAIWPAGRACAQAPTPPEAATKYTVNLSPAHQVGDKFGYVADVSGHQTIHIEGSLVGFSAINVTFNGETATHLEADGEVLAVFPNGSIKKVALTLKSLEAAADGKFVGGLPPAGTVIVAEALSASEAAAAKAAASQAKKTSLATASDKQRRDFNRDTIITIKDRLVPERVAQLLNGALALGNAEHTEQEGYGPTAPVVVGASWPIRFESIFYGALKGIQQGSGAVPGIIGAATLAGVHGSAEGTFATITGNFSGRDLKLTLPADAPVDSVRFSCVGNLTDAVPLAGVAGPDDEASFLGANFTAHVSKFLVFSAKVSGHLEMSTASENVPPTMADAPARDLALDPTNASAYFARGQAKIDRGDFAGGLADFDRVLAVNPKNVLAYVHRGEAYEKRVELDRAMVEYSTAVQADPKAAAAYTARAAAFGAQGNTSGALADYSAVIKLRPKDPDAYVDRAVARQNTGDYAGALADYDKAVELSEDDSTYPQLLRQALQMEHGKATPAFAKTVAGWKDGWPKMLGQFLAGKITEEALLAAMAKADAGDLSGRQCEAYYYIGAVHEARGDKAGARGFFEKAAATNVSDFYEYRLARGALARLEAPVALEGK